MNTQTVSPTPTPTPAAQLQSYTDRLKTSGQPILGMAVWYSVPMSAQIKRQDFIDLIDTHKAPIDKKGIPNKANVFRRACTAATLLKQPGPDVAERCNYKVADAGPDPEFVFKSIVEEIVDTTDHELGHRIVANMAFNKTNGKLVFADEVDSTDYAYNAYQHVKSGIQSFLQTQGDMLHDLPIRESARTAVENNLQGVRIRPGGGVYFVSSDRSEDLEAVNTVINAVDSATFHMLPLPDDPEQRAMLKNEYEVEVISVCDTLMEDLTDMLKSDKPVTHKKFSDALDRYNLVKKKTKEFSTLLNDALSTSETQISIVNRQMNKLSRKIGE